MLDRDGGLLGKRSICSYSRLSHGGRDTGTLSPSGLKRSTDGDLLVEKGPLYTVLHRLERNGWLAGGWGDSEDNQRAR